jgi:hypothetical protein
MTRTRWIALAWILLASGISIWWGSSIWQTKNGWIDFRSVYYGTRCLLHHHNPYKVSEFPTEGTECPLEPGYAVYDLPVYVNMPTTCIFMTPLAMMPWGPAHLLWTIFTVGVFILAGFLMWSLGARYSAKVSLLLVCFLLANCEVIVGGGNTAGIVIGLCVVAVWCFLEQRFVLVGVLCLAASLAIKPHDAGLVWLYFLLAGGVYRKRALQTLLITVVLGLSAYLWLSHIEPHWIQDWEYNLAALSAHGGLNDPAPAYLSGHDTATVIDLQAAISVFKNDPRFYNPASYLICGALLLLCAARTLRSRFTQRGALLALAAVVPITMLVTYHRAWDAKLLMITVPACALLWAEGGPIRWMALLVTAAGVVSTADIPLAILGIFSSQLHLGATGISGQILTVVLMRPTPLILLAMSIFYLWIYMRRDPERGLP